MNAKEVAPVKHVRSQADDYQDEISDLTAIDTGDESLTRQEFKDEADLNILLGRFGVDGLQHRQPQFGEIDYNMDLQQALAARDAVSRANFRVPEELREKYPDGHAVLAGVESGQYQKDLAQLQEQKDREAKEREDADQSAKVLQDLKARIRAERTIKREAEDLGTRTDTKD